MLVFDTSVMDYDREQIVEFILNRIPQVICVSVEGVGIERDGDGVASTWAPTEDEWKDPRWWS